MKIHDEWSRAAWGLWLCVFPLGIHAYPPLAGNESFSLASSALELRAECGLGGDITCWDLGVSCSAGYTCCSVTTCCKPTYACRSGLCVVEPVITSCLTSTVTAVSTLFSTVLSTVASTYWVVTTPAAVVVTRTSQTGVATNTVWATVTTILKRDTLPKETGVFGGVAQPIPGATHAMKMAGEHAGIDLRRLLLGKRTSIAYITYTSVVTSYKYAYATNYVTQWVTSTSGAAAPTSTTVIYNGASSTITTTMTTTVTSRTPPPDQGTTPAASSPSDPPPSSPLPSSTEVKSPTAANTPQPTTTQPAPNSSPDGQGTSSPVAPAPTTIYITPTFTTTGSNVPTLSLVTSTSSGVVVIFQTPAADSSSGGATGLSPSATIGIGVGSSVGAVVLLTALGLVFWRWRKKKADSGSGSNDSASRIMYSGPSGPDSDMMSTGGASRMTGAAFPGGEDKIVSPHSSMAGSPPPTHRTPPVPFPPPESYQPRPVHRQSSSTMAGYPPTRSEHMSWGSVQGSDIQEAPSSPSWSARGTTNSEMYAPNVYEAPPSQVIHEAPPEHYPGHTIYEAPEQHQVPYMGQGGTYAPPEHPQQPGAQGQWR
ncbi:hypothetical protein GQ53DRAFT_842251 [Thozetella sp. PMI_491]|nr:hypothetical protein GQ53DRAFT_842251 [Thozetella sp. PMI_491]